MLAWYQIAIGLIAAGALVALVANFVLTGRDVPNGILMLLSSIFGAVFAVDAVLKSRKTSGAPTEIRNPTVELEPLNPGGDDSGNR
jgi:hypothetical protein